MENDINHMVIEFKHDSNWKKAKSCRANLVNSTEIIPAMNPIQMKIYNRIEIEIV